MRKYFTRVTVYESKPGICEGVATVPVEFSAKGGPKGARRKIRALLRQDIPGRLPEEYIGPRFSLEYYTLCESVDSVPGSKLLELERMEF